MKKIIFILLFVPFLSISQNVEVIKFSQLEQIINSEKEKLLVINFWATWCKPCVKELPWFEQAHKNFKDKKVRVLLVSLDYPEKLEKILKPFLIKNKISATVVLLDDSNANLWIDKISPEWSGTIPATLMVKNGERFFYEKEFEYEELEQTITKNLKL